MLGTVYVVGAYVGIAFMVPGYTVPVPGAETTVVGKADMAHTGSCLQEWPETRIGVWMNPSPIKRSF